MVKLSPNVTSIGVMAKAAQDAGADAVSLVNTFLALAIDVETRKSRIANFTGGLSGPAIKPIALRMVYEAAQAVTIPVVGLGGIVRAEDAVEFMLAGATAVQVGTASYADPRAVENIANGMRRWCAEHDVARGERADGWVGAVEGGREATADDKSRRRSPSGMTTKKDKRKKTQTREARQSVWTEWTWGSDAGIKWSGEY